MGTSKKECSRFSEARSLGIGPRLITGEFYTHEEFAINDENANRKPRLPPAGQRLCLGASGLRNAVCAMTVIAGNLRISSAPRIPSRYPSAAITLRETSFDRERFPPPGVGFLPAVIRFGGYLLITVKRGGLHVRSSNYRIRRDHGPGLRNPRTSCATSSATIESLAAK